MINTNSSRSLANLSFKDGMTQMERVKCALDQAGPLSDRELSELTDIPRHLLPARRGELVKLGIVKRLKSAYDTETRQTVDVWATTSYIDRIMTQRSAEAVKQILAKSEAQISQVITGGLFCLAIFLISAKPSSAMTVVQKTTIVSKYSIVQPSLQPKKTPTPTVRVPSNKGSLTGRIQEQNMRGRYVASIIQTPEKLAVKQIVCQYFGDQCEVATAIFFAESGLRCEAVGDGGLAYVQNGVEYGKSYGVAQIRHLVGRPDPSTLLDCEKNVEYAHHLYERSGFYPWSAFTSGAYQKYLFQN